MMCLFLSLDPFHTNLLSVFIIFIIVMYRDSLLLTIIYFMNHLYFFLYHTSTSTRLFIHETRMTDILKTYLNTSCNGPLCVKLKDYTSVQDELKTFVARPGVKVWIGTEYTNYALYEVITPQVCLLTSFMKHCHCHFIS